MPHRTPIVLIDASGDAHADAMIAALRERSDSAVHAVVYSHRHHGYNAAVDVWPPNLQLL